MRKCIYCGALDSDVAFYASRKTACAPCVRRRANEYRTANLEKVREYDRIRGDAPHRVEARAKHRATYKGPVKPVIPERRAVNVKVGNALRDARITRPRICEACGRDERLDAHHYDYSKPMEILWVCKPCHGRIHKWENDRARRIAMEIMR